MVNVDICLTAYATSISGALVPPISGEVIHRALHIQQGTVNLYAVVHPHLINHKAQKI